MTFHTFLFFILGVCLLCSGQVSAKGVSITVSPNPAVLEENATIRVEIEMQGEDIPEIEFDPINIEVLEKNLSGQSSSTIIVNGSITVSKKFIYTIEVLPKKEGTAYLRNVRVIEAGKSKTVPNFAFKVLKTAQGPSPFFVMAVPDKTRAYVGESIIVRYYLYKRVAVQTFEIRKFPKLSGLLKRFRQENTRSERVQYNGDWYERSVLYTAQLFAEKPGELEVDPIQVKVKYPVRDSSDPFGNFGLGLGLRNVRSKTISSGPIQLSIKELPLEGQPPHFSGLVGPHNFELRVSKSKFLVNEPIELTLKVKGMGALENFEAPNILSDSRLEEFETNADLNIQEDFSAVKEFEYTYLARSPFSLDEQNFPLSYFNTETQRYVTQNLKMPALQAAGGTQIGAAANQNSDPISDSSQENSSFIRPEVGPSGPQTYAFLSPEFSDSIVWPWRFIYFVLALVLLVLMVLLGKDLRSASHQENPRKDIWKEIQSKGLNYHRLYQFLYLSGVRDKGASETLDGLPVSQKAKLYFSGLLEELAKKQYAHGKMDSKFRIEKRFFREVLKV